MAQAAKIQTLTNGQLYDEFNEGCWARLRGETITPERQSRLDAIEAELLSRPVEPEVAQRKSRRQRSDRPLTTNQMVAMFAEVLGARAA